MNQLQVLLMTSFVYIHRVHRNSTSLKLSMQIARIEKGPTNAKPTRHHRKLPPPNTFFVKVGVLFTQTGQNVLSPLFASFLLLSLLGLRSEEGEVEHIGVGEHTAAVASHIEDELGPSRIEECRIEHFQWAVLHTVELRMQYFRT